MTEMRRRWESPPPAQPASPDLAAFVAGRGDRAKKERRAKRPRSVGKCGWEKALEEAAERIRTGDWEGARPLALVATYAALHEKIYGVAPAELTPKVRMYAAGMASRMLAVEFDGDAGAMADFMRWTWRREKEKEARRRKEQSDSSFRIGWRLQFGGAVLTDYRAMQNRRASA